MSVDERKRFASTMLPSEVHRELCRQATRVGIHPSELVGRYVAQGLEQDAEIAKKPDYETKIYRAVQRAQRGDRLRGQLKRIAWQYLRNRDEEEYDLLVSLCEEGGFEVEELLDQAGTYDQAPATLTGSGRGLEGAIAFLQKLGEEGDEYPVSAVLARGAEQGLPAHILGDAKRRLGITSVRGPKSWAWVWAKQAD